jgi:hypothetical protein
VSLAASSPLPHAARKRQVNAVAAANFERVMTRL